MKFPLFPRILLSIALLCIFAGILFLPKQSSRVSENILPTNKLTEVSVGNSKLFVEKALNENEWSRGLSNRTELNSNTGMIFIFPTSEIKMFWMKDTLVPLDIIWIADKTVVGIDHMLTELYTANALLKRYISPFPVDTVIETNLNWTTKNNIRIGDKLSF